MSPVGTVVATSERRFREFSWNQKKIAVTLHRQNLDQASKELNEFELFRAEEVSSVAQSEQTTSERQEKRQ